MRSVKLLLFLLVLVVSALFAGNTWHGVRYERLQREVKNMEEEQKEWLERNKKLIAGLAVFGSPVRIEKLAEQLGLVRKDRPGFVLSAENEYYE